LNWENEMPINPKIMAAISGALGAYLADEEAATRAMVQAVPPAPAGPMVNLWALAGRSQAMQLRLLMQRRSLR
jgi:hypothetical protein